MDKIDRMILRELQRNGRMANADLATKVGLTPTPCLRRVRNLEKIGAIRGYRAELDGNFLDSGFHAFATVAMKHDNRATMTEFESRITELPQVIETHRLFGDPDYLLRIAVADIAAYERFYTEVLCALPGINKLTSHMTMKEVKAHRGFLAGLE
ncbi:Lrp/AsnC family transcriptional regulator [Streptomyces sp. NPDC090442]|jgi:Lrp/AsnC family transcriptional regulator, leucine-responsive regulatory protein|uniref:Lrp/AsnC family transcriptional regulator n=1 Tax=Streptomyces sp. NPDC090442 TaxID=3365962 RepID=UPI0038013D21